jgi:hypothetical protein
MCTVRADTTTTDAPTAPPLPQEPVRVFPVALPKTDLPSVEAEPTKLGKSQ